MSDQIHPAAIDATGYVGDGSRFLADDGTWSEPPAPGGTGVVETIVPGTGIAVDSTDPANPVVSATGGGGGGGTAAQQYVGKSTVGAAWEGMTWRRVYLKKVALAQDGLLTSIEAYIRQGAGQVGNLLTVLHADSGGAVGQIISYCGTPVANALAMSATTPDRWFSQPVGRWLAAGSYWIGVVGLDNSMSFQIPYDAGSDIYYNSGGNWVADGGEYASVASGRDYSIRANVITL